MNRQEVLYIINEIIEEEHGSIEKLDPTKPLLIETADTTGFGNYFEHVEDDVYVFKGLR